MRSVQDLLGGRAKVQLALSVDESGRVIHAAGSGDAESFGAMTLMCNGAMDAAGQQLGLGDLDGWVAVSEDGAYYAGVGSGDIIACSGLTSRTAAHSLAEIIAVAQGPRR